MQGTLSLTTATKFQDSEKTQQAMQDLITAYGQTFPNNLLNVQEIAVKESQGSDQGSVWRASDPAYPNQPDGTPNGYDVSPTYFNEESAGAMGLNISTELYTEDFIARKMKAIRLPEETVRQRMLQFQYPDYAVPKPLAGSPGAAS